MAEVFRNYLAGRNLANQEQDYRNQLAQQQVENQRQNQLMQMRHTEFDNAQQDRLQQQELSEQERLLQAGQRISGLGRKSLTIADPVQRRQFLQVWMPRIRQDFMDALGQDTNDLAEFLGQPDAELEADLQNLAAFNAPDSQWVDEKGPRGTVLQRNRETGELRQVVAQQPSPPASLQVQFRTLSPEEVQAQGFPAGTVVQQNANTGELNVVTKRDNTGSLSQKDMTTARQKLSSVQLAKQQLQAIKDAFSTGTKGVNAFGPGQGLLPTQQGKAFDAAVDQMRSTLTALTRVPGVGAMSDYETRLDQAKFPKRSDYETVTAQKIQGIEDMLATIERGYQDLLGGQPQQQQPVSPSGPGASDIDALLNKYAPRQ